MGLVRSNVTFGRCVCSRNDCQVSEWRMMMTESIYIPVMHFRFLLSIILSFVSCKNMLYKLFPSTGTTPVKETLLVPSLNNFQLHVIMKNKVMSVIFSILKFRSNAWFCLIFSYSYMKLVHIFSVNPHLGPLQISLGRMIIDILKFFFIYSLVLFAFGCGEWL